MSRKLKRSRARLDFDQRELIEQYLNESRSFAGIARDLGVSPSTIQREVRRNRRNEGISGSRRNADRTNCEHARTCKLKALCVRAQHGECFESKYCKRCTKEHCHNHCDSYEVRICPTIENAPFVCNACKRYYRCTLERFKYSARTAQSSADTRNSEARSGFDLTSAEVEYLIETVRAGLSLGHSIHHIFAANEMPCSERTFYRLVEEESIPILNIELAKKVKYKKRKGKKETTVHPKGFYVGHEYKDYMRLPLSERAITTEVDTVWGTKRDKKTILSLHRVDLHFQIYVLLPERSRTAVVEALDWLEACCEGRFTEFFGLMLFDRGSEFDDIERMERSLVEGNKRTQTFFTDPNRPDQKGACEKNHVELRKVLPKGTSLEGMNSYILSDICSHVNSTIRKGCGSTTPIQLAQMCMPDSLFDNLGLTLIAPNKVIAAPGILY